ncbi:MAG: hypothetical protein ACRBFS_12510 [Aureispira sp.]
MRGRLLSKENILILVLQAILCLIAFNKFFVHPTDTMFMDLFDGIKNYFTFQSYLQQDASVGLALVQGHAYPFGDYLFYADLTPTIAVPLRLFSIYVYDISDYGIPIFNWIIILLHWITALVAYRLTKHFVKTPWLAVVLAISFTWINPQLGRLGNGHFNLSVSLFIVMTLLFLVHIYKGYQADPERYFSTHKATLGALLATLYFASFTHLYFLPILGITIGFFALFHALELKFKQQQSWVNSLKPLVVMGALCFAGLVLVMGTILIVDSYYSLRAVGNSAYGFSEWELSIPSLFTAREFNYISYLFSYTEPIHYESNLYMGAFTLYSLTFLVLLKFFGKSMYLSTKTLFMKQPFLGPMLGVGFCCFFVAMGDAYYFLDNQYFFKNYFNPFFYLRKIVSTIEQFRCLARFYWPAFWIFSLAVASCVDYYYRNHSKSWMKGVVGALALLAVSDAKDVVSFQNRAYWPNFFTKAKTETGYKAIDAIEHSKYQAILPLPYFHNSTELDGLVLNGGAYYNKETQRISLLTNLPMMSVQSSRLPVTHTRHLFSLFFPPYPDQELLDQFNDQPILVLYHKDFHEKMDTYGSFDIPPVSPAKDVVWNGQSLPTYYNMKKISEDETYIVYEWDPKAINASNVDAQEQDWDMENIAVTTPMSAADSSQNNYLEVLMSQNTLSQQHAHAGKQGVMVSPENKIVLQHVLHQVVPGTSIEMTLWRHRSATNGAFVAEGKDYFQSQEVVLQEEEDWQQIKASFFLPLDYQGTMLKLHYWNATAVPVYIDDFSIKVYTPIQ